MKTPRTDAVMLDQLRDGNDLPALARQLETKLATARSFLRDASMRADGYMYGMDKARAELAAMTALADRLAEALSNLKTEVANTLWTSRDGAEMIPGTAESIREEVNEAIDNAFESSVKALATYESHKNKNKNHE